MQRKKKAFQWRLQWALTHASWPLTNEEALADFWLPTEGPPADRNELVGDEKKKKVQRPILRLLPLLFLIPLQPRLPPIRLLLFPRLAGRGR